jgi:hypothetical protein
MKTIPLSQGLSAVVDDGDFDRLRQFKWYAVKKRNTYYARRNLRPGPPHCIYMHQQIMHPGPGQIMDHIDGNGLNNRRANLRLCTVSQNDCNRTGVLGRGGFKGVFRSAAPGLRSDRWYARIVAKRRPIHLGCFGTPEDAARAYDAAALKYHGEFAKLNFPQDVPAREELVLK